ncbi:MAG TPA: hypothetical protein VD763_11610 [Candidatus Saccharimonadales bacterium]|nr:hypothetical protein [Candidatus Saccharimonadales bacterium]
MTPVRSITALATIVVAGSLLAAGPAMAHGPDPVLGGALFSQNERLEFRWRGGSEPPAAIRTAIRDAAADVTDTKASKAATFAYDASGANPIGYGLGATCGVNGLACFTRSAPDGFTMWLREHGHVFDWGTLKWCQMYATPPNGCYDAETIALDEFGHIEILGHHDNYDDDRDYLDAVVQTFSRTKPRAGYDMHVLGRCDVATLQREYDVVDSIAKYSTCLDIDSVVTLSGPATVAYGGTASLSAFLEVVDRDTYDRLRGNNLSKRTVRLQRRSPGTTDWVTVGTMTPGTASGTYTTSLTLRSDTEFRASFATPSGEGLNGDNSAVLFVNVAACTGTCPLATGR